MKKFRIRNWLILIFLISLYGILKYFELDGFWSGFSVGAAAVIFIGELFWLIKKRDMNDYLLKEEEDSRSRIDKKP